MKLSRPTIRIACALSLFVAVPGASALASPASSTRRAPVNKGIGAPAARKVLNGKVEVDPVGQEFVAWYDRLEFEEAPLHLDGRWSENDAATRLANWQLHEVVDGKNVWVASGKVRPIEKVDGLMTFDIEPAALIPKYNTTGKDRVYLLRVYSEDVDVSGFRSSLAATLIHKPKGWGTIPPEDPFTCGYSADKYARAVSITAPFVTVHNTSNTAGDNNGQDELEFRVAQWGPGIHTSDHTLPGGDIGYALNEGDTINVFTWHDDDDNSVPTPTFLNTVLRHGEKTTVAVLAMERDNGSLKAIKDFIIAGNTVVSVVGKAVGGWGVVVGAAADGVIAANELFAPDTDSNDYVGHFAVVFENRCGRIKSSWYTLGAASLGGELVSGTFPDPSTQPGVSEFDARSVTIYKPKDDKSTFSPGGWDYGDFSPVGPDDAFHWVTRGTSGLHYTFILLAQTNLPLGTGAGLPPTSSGGSETRSRSRTRRDDRVRSRTRTKRRGG
ncbi:MAG: hypothetical protein AB1Z98_39250 [Nannocystaceae bacterium]